jgi:magnesium-transporting ATPase (P-type)
MLTGESLPVLKTSIPNEHDACYDPEADKRFTLFSGTQAMEARRLGGAAVTAVILRSGFATAKGRLVRSILYPKPSSFEFYADSFKFVAVMGLFAIAGFLWSVAAFVKYNVDLRDVILNACDVVTIAVPPALPAAMTIGTEFAIERLRACSIFCISPNRVNMCGQVDLVCFDKTGTLTEEGVDVRGVLPTDEHAVGELTRADEAPTRLLQCLACCHGLTLVAGELIGDPLDLKMFASTGWVLQEPPEDERHDSVVPPRVFPPIPTPRSMSASSSLSGGMSDGSNDPEMMDATKRWASLEGLAIIKRFDFTSHHQRMSVIARNDHDRGSHVFLKGAPEVPRGVKIAMKKQRDGY